MAEPDATLALVGGESLVGRDLRELTESAALPARIKLISSTDDAERILARQQGEAVVLSPPLAEELSSAAVVVLAGSPVSSRKTYARIRQGPNAPTVIDVNGGLEDSPHARLRAPQVEEQPSPGGKLQVIAHPGAIALALFLRRLQRANPLRRSVVLGFEPASERGQRGLDELQQQTVALLSFQKLKKKVYDAQLGFNMLSAYGSEAPRALEDIEQQMDRHIASLLAMPAAAGLPPMPSLRLIQAPVFHGYSFSVWAEFETQPDLDAIATALRSDRIEVRTADEEPPTNAGAAGQSGITVGQIVADRNHPRACWFWMVADNLRIAAENAIEVVREVLA